MINLQSVSVFFVKFFLPFGPYYLAKAVFNLIWWVFTSKRTITEGNNQLHATCIACKLVFVYEGKYRDQLLPTLPGSEAVHLTQVKQTSHWKTRMFWTCPRNSAGCAHTHPHTRTLKLISTGEIQWPAALLGALSSAHLASNRPMNLLTANSSFAL